jgi:alkylation response protein AidB-like acyl-CoA dehydrogenase
VTVLTNDLLERIRSRAAGYDRDNAFFTEDLDDLRAAGYLAPRSLLETANDQRLLARFAPATALGINMHLVWTGVARVLSERGIDTLDWVLEDAAASEIFAFGNSEAGNDLVLFDSRTTATPGADGSYSFTGTKIFTSLSPAWTRLGIFGRDDSDPENPQLVHGFITRDTPGWSAKDDWNTLGMRATQSQTTVLADAVVPAERIARILPVGPSPDPFIFGIFSNFLLLISSVYAGLADRALELAVEAVDSRTSLRNDGAKLSQDPDLRWQVADAAIAVDSIGPSIETLSADVDNLVNHGANWFRYLTGTKLRTIDTARRVVDHAIRVSGGRSYSADSELSRLYRDALAGLFHPSDAESVHNTVANAVLGPLI